MRDRGVSLPITALHHHLPCLNARWRGLRLVAHHHSALEREMEGLCCLATALQLTPLPPPSLKREMEGLFCPPPPPLPLSNARRRGVVAHHRPQFTPPPPHSLECEMEAITIPPSFKSDTLGGWHHHPTSLTQMRPGGHTCPPPSSRSLERNTDLDTYVFDYFMKLYSHIKL